MDNTSLNDTNYNFAPLEIFVPDPDYHPNEKDLKNSMDKNRQLLKEAQQYRKTIK